MNFEQLSPGYEFAPAVYKLDEPLVSRYIKAVGGGQCQTQYVPPLAIAAHALAALAKSLELSPGSIHAAQDFEFFKLVPLGATIKCKGKVAQKVSRGKLRMLMVEIDALNEKEEKVLWGKATLILPA